MAVDLAFTPAGHVKAVELASGDEAVPDGLVSEAAVDGPIKKVVKAFAAGEGSGLFLLATERFDAALPPSFAYWRDFACRYLTALCHAPETAGVSLESVEPPEAAELAALLLGVPPMRGAEYLSQSALTGVWEAFDSWVRGEVIADGEGLSSFLKRRAPLWHQVGRVCFHLAENRRDEDHPFAFLATYAPGMASGARIQYQPLSGALRELAGAKNKKALIHLLSPVHLASQQSALVKDMLDTGDLYQPLAWTPREAYRFLKDVPAFEASGVLVRLPDWWKKRPRPRVGVTIGDRKQQKFDAGSMLDFNVQLALGDQQLTEAEWRQLMAADDGLVLLRGQWVEIDRQKLQQALDHWKQVQREAEGGVSFIEGMRLLAGVPADLTDGQEAEAEERQWSFVHAGQWLGEILAKMRGPENLKPVATGDAMKATLRKYQETGVGWLRFLSGLGLGACLADDMGLGKTVQVLALLLALKEQGGAPKPSVLVLPASLLANWKAEMARFTPTLRAVFVHPAETSKEELDRMATDPERALQGADLVITTYGMLLRQAWLLDMHWQLAMLDEAQAIKNPAPGRRRPSSDCRPAPGSP